MNKKWYFSICFSALGAGILFFVTRYELVILYPKQRAAKAVHSSLVPLKEYTTYFFAHHTWCLEKVMLNAEQPKEVIVRELVQAWLQVLQQEKVSFYKVVTLENCIINARGVTVYFSFDKTPFEKQSSIQDRLLWLEGLLKTVASAQLKLQEIYFLVNHEPLNDPYLDFNFPYLVPSL